MGTHEPELEADQAQNSGAKGERPPVVLPGSRYGSRQCNGGVKEASDRSRRQCGRDESGYDSIARLTAECL